MLKLNELLNKNTLIINANLEYIFENIYNRINEKLDKTYIISRNQQFLKIVEKLYSFDNIRNIHEDMLQSFLFCNDINCCLIFDNINLDFNNRYFLDILQNKDNNITLVVLTDDKSFNNDFLNYFSNVIDLSL